MQIKKKMVVLFFTLCSILSGCVIHVGAQNAGEDIDSVLGSINVDAGKKVGNLDTVNGSISLKDNVIAKSLETVNGSIKVGNDCTIDSAETVNGSIRIGDKVTVGANLETVNGRITIGTGGAIKGRLETVNGDQKITDSAIGGSLETVNGDITLQGKSVVSGDIIFQKPGDGWFSSWFHDDEDSPDVTLKVSKDSEIKGTIHLYRKVKLEIAEGAKVGPIKKHYATK